ncbi:tyrosine-type recombinase/integrase [Verrucomicrobiaceae bacterium 5K15]|uniref:Tyrosine-type recombinase/integrase n=1 Tax=Oceaniferula flava TaxID=2800421 RepID=A0AAE2SB81_9BACT|nr:tyrosine-type recombinase/integrase [Oceaniferula flavus]MBK1854986.1 tyrosine-type recombinase/integrase [Oceaniferula flavus]MBM1136292.1 tyrosine-type recombinase/integrase [Oceaniferula flavus]
MAVLIKKGTSKYWHAQYLVPTDKGTCVKVNRSTKETSKRKALLKAVEFERAALREAGAGNVKGRKMLAVLTRATEHAELGKLNVTKAREFMAEIVKIATGEDMPEYTVRTWTKEWLTRKSGKAESSLRAYRTNAKHFLEGLGEKADHTLESITVADMRKLRDWLQFDEKGERKSSVTTVNQKMKTASSIFITAMAEGITNFNPVAALEKLENDDKVQRKPFTKKEVAALVKHAPSEEWKGLILLGAYTGLRLVDCASLTWGDIDMTNEVIATLPAKTKRKKTVVRIPIHPALAKWLKTRPTAINPATQVFPTLSQYLGAGRNGLSTQFNGIMEKAKVSRGKSVQTGSKTFHEKSFHSLRHTLTSWLSDAKVPPEIRMQILGHKSEEVHAGYTHHQDHTLKTAMQSIPNL